ncbi:MAG: hypothetical protein JSS07_09420 [Proteobacteria bacterium]|nr:hypothetical protein [Pseudomonadota bacterium]
MQVNFNQIVASNSNEMFSLTKDALPKVFSFLDVQDLLNAKLTFTLFSEYANSPLVWQQMIIKYFPYLEYTKPITFNQTPQSLFIAEYLSYKKIIEDKIDEQMDSANYYQTLANNARANFENSTQGGITTVAFGICKHNQMLVFQHRQEVALLNNAKSHILSALRGNVAPFAWHEILKVFAASNSNSPQNLSKPATAKANGVLDKAFLIAASKGNLAGVKNILAVHDLSFDSISHALDYDQFSVASLIIEQKPAYVTPTAIQKAINKNQIDIFKKMLVTRTSQEQILFFYQMSRRKNDTAIVAFLESCSQALDLQEDKTELIKLLCQGVEENNISLVKIILNTFPDLPEAKELVLYLAAKNDHLELISLVINKQAKVIDEELILSAFKIAVKEGHLDKVQEIISQYLSTLAADFSVNRQRIEQAKNITQAQLRSILEEKLRLEQEEIAKEIAKEEERLLEIAKVKAEETRRIEQQENLRIAKEVAEKQAQEDTRKEAKKRQDQKPLKILHNKMTKAKQVFFQNLVIVGIFGFVLTSFVVGFGGGFSLIVALLLKLNVEILATKATILSVTLLSSLLTTSMLMGLFWLTKPDFHKQMNDEFNRLTLRDDNFNKILTQAKQTIEKQPPLSIDLAPISLDQRQSLINFEANKNNMARPLEATIEQAMPKVSPAILS